MVPIAVSPGETMSVSSPHGSAQVYRRLERTTRLIVQHPDFPGKDEAVRRCRDDIEQRFGLGELTEEQRTRLQSILRGDILPD
jgi:hypothetical protein